MNKPTNKQVAEIKSLLGVVRQVDLAAKFNVKRSVIADISAGRSWNRG
jgi:predicted transcriptional regulator